jgi:hypothetical protein
MILPTKGISPDRALLSVGGEVLDLLTESTTVSRLWHDLLQRRMHRDQRAPVTYDWFVLALDFLFTIGAIELDERTLIRRVEP